MMNSAATAEKFEAWADDAASDAIMDAIDRAADDQAHARKACDVFERSAGRVIGATSCESFVTDDGLRLEARSGADAVVAYVTLGAGGPVFHHWHVRVGGFEGCGISLDEARDECADNGGAL